MPPARYASRFCYRFQIFRYDAATRLPRLMPYAAIFEIYRCFAFFALRFFDVFCRRRFVDDAPAMARH